MSQSIVLASSSKYRAALLKQLLQQLRLDFIQFAPEIDEAININEKPDEAALRLSTSKAKVAAKRYPDSVVIASDQVPFLPARQTNDLTLSGSILRKPRTEKNAISQLELCSGSRVEFHTGLCVISPNHPNYAMQSCVELFDVVFRTLTRKEIKRYVAIEKPLDCAGAFKVEGLGISLFERLEGKDYNALIGLPLIQLCNFLRNSGFNIP